MCVLKHTWEAYFAVLKTLFFDARYIHGFKSWLYHLLMEGPGLFLYLNLSLLNYKMGIIPTS